MINEPGLNLELEAHLSLESSSLDASTLEPTSQKEFSDRRRFKTLSLSNFNSPK